MRFLILIPLSFFWLGCPGPSASLLLTTENESERSKWDYFTSETEGTYRTIRLVAPESLNNLPLNTTIKIDLRNELVIVSESIELRQDSLFYSSKDVFSSIHLSEISRILVYDKYTANDFCITTGNSFLTGAAVANFPATSRDSFQEAGKSALIGGSIFIILGNLLEYRSSKTFPVEVIYVSGVQEYKY